MAAVVGTLWMIGFAALFDLKMNFLNFVVIPITLGISVDYGANIFSRYRLEGPGSMAHVLRSTGPAVVLSSATTILGYASLITSTNMALQSFGIIADIGEFTTLATAEIVMCALIVWLEQSTRKPTAAGAPTNKAT
jgi:predicted RND superfamily exporter protein